MISLFSSLKNLPSPKFHEISRERIVALLGERGFVPKSLTLLRDDLLPLGLGTKARRAEALASWCLNHGKKKVILFGSIHSNFLCSYTAIFRSYNIPTIVFGYSKDPKKKTYNSILSKSFATELLFFPTKKLAQEAAGSYPSHPNIVKIAEWGIHPSLHLSLREVWKAFETYDQKKKKCKKDSKPPVLLLDIGSGFSFLSAFSYFQGKDWELRGYLVGEKKNSWLSKVPDLQKQLGLEPIPIRNKAIFSAELRYPLNPNPYLPLLGEVYKEWGVLLEPVYSCPTWKWWMESRDFQDRDLYYLHQGGQFQHLSRVLGDL